MRNLSAKVKKGVTTNEEALSILSDSINEFAKENSKSIELLAYQQEIENLKHIKLKSLGFIDENKSLDQEYKNLSTI